MSSSYDYNQTLKERKKKKNVLFVMVNTKTKSHQALSLAQCLKMDGCQLPVGGATSSLGPVQGLHYMRVHDGQLKVVS